MASTGCGPSRVVSSCSCQPGADGAVRACTKNDEARRCEMTLYCFEGDCLDAQVSATCVVP